MADNTLVSRSSIALDGGNPPTSFRIFRKGINHSTKGDDLFDDEAARSVMAHAAEYSNAYCVDVNHDSLNPAALAARADAGEAIAWFRLALKNGELHAVDVRWTERGRALLASKAFRYISPAFQRDPDTGRVLEFINAGLVAQPALHGAPELVAASRLGRANSAMVGARLPLTVRARFEKEAATIGLSPGQFLRCLAMLATRSADSEDTLKNLRVALKLDKDAPVEVIRAALDALLKEVDADVPADPTNASGTVALSRDVPRVREPGVRYADEFTRVRARLTPPASGDDESPRVRSDEPGRTVRTSLGEITLSSREIKNCAEQGVPIEAYARNKMIREAAQRGRR